MEAAVVLLSFCRTRNVHQVVEALTTFQQEQEYAKAAAIPALRPTVGAGSVDTPSTTAQIGAKDMNWAAILMQVCDTHKLKLGLCEWVRLTHPGSTAGGHKSANSLTFRTAINKVV